MRKRENSISFIFFALLQAFPSATIAHGMHAAEPIDFSLPLNYYMVGSVFTVIASFILMAVFARTESSIISLPSYRVRFLDFVFTRFFKEVLSTISLLFFTLLLVAGFFGIQEGSENIISVGLWVLFGVGLTYFVLFFGDIWSLLHPSVTIHRWLSKATKSSITLEKRYPGWLGVWPALFLFFAFRWLENIFKYSDVPYVLAIILSGYFLISFIGIVVFGKDAWLRNGDPFGVFFRILGKIGIFSAKERKIFIHPPATNLLAQKTASFSETVFILLMLTSIAFDSLKDKAIWEHFWGPLGTMGIPPVPRETVGFVCLLATFCFLFFFISVLVELFSGRIEKAGIPWRNFAYTFLPIAAGYELAHYLGFFLIEGQRIIPLLSDPLGFGWNIFGTAQNQIIETIISQEMYWKLQVFFIVSGHVISVIAAHSVALSLYKNSTRAILSQIPMIMLMLSYTVFSLWIIAQASV